MLNIPHSFSWNAPHGRVRPGGGIAPSIGTRPALNGCAPEVPPGGTGAKGRRHRPIVACCPPCVELDRGTPRNHRATHRADIAAARWTHGSRRAAVRDPE